MEEVKNTETTEASKPRTLEEVNKDYTNLCTILGEKAYHVELGKTHITNISQKILELDQEAAAIKRTPTEVKAE